MYSITMLYNFCLDYTLQDRLFYAIRNIFHLTALIIWKYTRVMVSEIIQKPNQIKTHEQTVTKKCLIA